MTIWKGVTYPIGGTLADFLKDRGDDNSIKTSIINILLTKNGDLSYGAYGERVMRPDLGSGFSRLIFEPNDLTTDAEINRIVKNDVESQDDRVEIVGVELTKDDPNIININVRYINKKVSTDKSQVNSFSFSISSSGKISNV